jgi:hypothetical protein
MTKKLFLAVTMLFALTFVAMAADVTGKWTAQVPGRGGQMMDTNFNFKQEGEKLTGTMTGFGGMEIPISEGKVAGDNISFETSIDRGGQTFKQNYTGTVAGSEIKFKREGGRGPIEFVAKKAQ